MLWRNILNLGYLYTRVAHTLFSEGTLPHACGRSESSLDNLSITFPNWNYQYSDAAVVKGLATLRQRARKQSYTALFLVVNNSPVFSVNILYGGSGASGCLLAKLIFLQNTIS